MAFIPLISSLLREFVRPGTIPPRWGRRRDGGGKIGGMLGKKAASAIN